MVHMAKEMQRQARSVDDRRCDHLEGTYGGQDRTRVPARRGLCRRCLARGRCRGTPAVGRNKSRISSINCAWNTRAFAERRAAKNEAASLIPIAEARANPVAIDWASFEPTPPAESLHVFDDVPDDENLIPYIDWTFFFHAWQLRGHFRRYSTMLKRVRRRASCTRMPPRCLIKSSPKAGSRRRRWSASSLPTRLETMSSCTPTRRAQGYLHDPAFSAQTGKTAERSLQ